MGSQNPAEISRNLGGQNPAEISKSRRPKSCRKSHAENVLQGRYCFGHPNKMFRFPFPSLSWRWNGRSGKKKKKKRMNTWLHIKSHV